MARSPLGGVPERHEGHGGSTNDLRLSARSQAVDSGRLLHELDFLEPQRLHESPMLSSAFFLA